MTKASDNVYPRLLISEGGSTATPAANRVTVYAKSDGLLYSKDDAGAETALGGGASITDITDIPTAEMDDALVLAPDGAGGVEFRAEAAGGLSSYATYLTGLSGLVHRWKFEESSGNFADSVGSLTLTASGAFVYSVAGGPVSGASGSVTFGASGKGTSSGLGSIPTGGSARTFVLVFKGKESSSKQCLYSYGAASTRAWWTAFLNDSSTDQHSLAIYSDDALAPGAPGNDGVWHLHVAVCDGASTGTNTLWIDGAPLVRRIGGGAVNTTNSGNFTIGQDTAGANQLGAVTFDDLAIFSRALAPWEIHALFMRLGT